MIEWDRIAALMEQHNLTAYKLSKETGIAQGNFTAWKRGATRPGHGAIARIAEYFGVDAAYIRGETDDPRSDDWKDMDDIELAALHGMKDLSNAQKRAILEMINNMNAK